MLLHSTSPQLKHVLMPKKKGFVACVQELRKSEHIPAIYDMTVAYSEGPKHVRPAHPCMEEMMDGKVTPYVIVQYMHL